jgi:hypothetical protein
MPRFQKTVNCDIGYADGHIFVPFTTGDVLVGSGATINRTAAGNWQLSLPTAATAYTIDAWLSRLIFRSGLQDDLQEYFGGGGSAGAFASARGLTSPSNAFSTPAGVSGPPPFTGVTQFTPVTSARPKGIQINSISAWYQVGSANATVNTIALYQTVAANATAPAVTTVLAASNLTLTAAATPYLTTVSLSSPAYLNTLNAAFSLEWNVTTGASTGTASIWGVFLNVTYNYN